jgi:hypothetical protein
VSAVAAQPRRRVGRPACCPPETARRILELKDQGFSLRQIARLLNDEVVLTPMGLSKWSKSHVYRVLGTLYVRELSEELP